LWDLAGGEGDSVQQGLDSLGLGEARHVGGRRREKQAALGKGRYYSERGKMRIDRGVVRTLWVRQKT